MQGQTVPILERIVPDELARDGGYGRDVLDLHLERYRFAARWAAGARILDIACGVGYGTEILRAAGGREVVGVDRDAGALAYARARYAAPAVTFREAEAEAFEDSEPFDVIVCLETVEHVRHPARFLALLARLLRPGGHLIASVPTSPSTDINPYHLHDFTENGFRSLLRGLGLEIVGELSQVQSIPVGAVLGGVRGVRPVSSRLPSLYGRSPRLLWKRIGWTLRHGLTNRYLVLVARR